MDEFLAVANGPWGGAAVIFAIGVLALTGKIVWHTALARERERGDRWERMALQLLGATQKLTVQAEVTNEIVSRLPSPVSQPFIPPAPASPTAESGEV